jgi:hypothetical protein
VVVVEESNDRFSPDFVLFILEPSAPLTAIRPITGAER